MFEYVAKVDVIRRLGAFESKTTFWVDMPSDYTSWPSSPSDKFHILNLVTDWCVTGLRDVTPIDVRFVQKNVTVYSQIPWQVVWKQTQFPNETSWTQYGAFPSPSYYREFAVAVDLVSAYGPIVRQWWAFVPDALVEKGAELKVEGIALYNYIIETRPSSWMAVFPVRQVFSTIANRSVQPIMVTHNKRRIMGTR